MKKSLVVMVVLVSSLALAGTALASYDWACYEMPVCKPVCNDQVLCLGKAKGKIPLCGPCAPVVCFSGKWLTVAKCPVVKVEKAQPVEPFITLPKAKVACAPAGCFAATAQPKAKAKAKEKK